MLTSALSKGVLRNLTRFSSSNSDQSIGASSNGSEIVLPVSLLLPYRNEDVEAMDCMESLRASLTTNVGTPSMDEGNRKDSIKLAVPEFRRKLIEPLSEAGVFCCSGLDSSSSYCQ